VAVAEYFIRGLIYEKIHGAKMSLFGYNLDILCMEHLRFVGAIWGANFSVW